MAFEGRVLELRVTRTYDYPIFRELWGRLSLCGAFDVYMCCDWHLSGHLNAVTYYDILALIVWNKPTGGLGNPYRRKYELMVFARPKTSDTVMSARW